MMSLTPMHAPLIDCHCHLQHPSFVDDFEAMLQRARQAGVRAVVCNATCERDWDAAAGLAARYPEVIPCFGIHPWYLGGRSSDWQENAEEDSYQRGRKRSTIGSLPTLTGIFGLTVAHCALEMLLKDLFPGKRMKTPSPED